MMMWLNQNCIFWSAILIPARFDHTWQVPLMDSGILSMKFLRLNTSLKSLSVVKRQAFNQNHNISFFRLKEQPNIVLTVMQFFMKYYSKKENVLRQLAVAMPGGSKSV